MDAVANRQRLWRIRAAVPLSGLAVFSQLYLFQPLLPELCEAFGISPATSSFAISGGTLGMALGLFVFAFAADTLGRRRLMIGSIVGSSLLTMGSALAPSFAVLVAINVAKGAMLSAVSAVALAYLSEELPPRALGFAISLYLSGNIFGGMSGRVAAGLLSGWLAWPAITFLLGAACLALGGAFAVMLPDSRHFQPRPLHVGRKLQRMGAFLRAPSLVTLFAIALLLMGVFVSAYNYLEFRLQGPPFSLPHYVIALVFLMYLAGIAGSLLAGRWSDAWRPAPLLPLGAGTLVTGALLLLTDVLWLTVLGLGVLTFGFFVAHTAASRLVSERAGQDRSTAISLYWLFYYVGSTVIGSATGVALAHFGWAAFVGTLAALGLTALSLGAVSLRRAA